MEPQSSEEDNFLYSRRWSRNFLIRLGTINYHHVPDVPSMSLLPNPPFLSTSNIEIFQALGLVLSLGSRSLFMTISSLHKDLKWQSYVPGRD